VKFIQLLYAAGLSSKSVRQLLPCIDTGQASPAMLEHLTQERERLQEQVTAMTAARDRMDAVIAATAQKLLTEDAPTCSL
jgi:hypothetical protein